MTQRPADTEYAPFYAGYISLVPETDVMEVLERQGAEIQALAAAAPTERERYRYAPGKWSVREVLGHVVDTERVFGYRAFCIGRGDRTPLPGFDENAYQAQAGHDERTLTAIAGELAAVREANLCALRRFDDTAWRRVGTANASAVSVRALAFIMAGHARHHLGVLRSRYGVPAT